MYTNFRALSSQYSRRLLSILARQSTKNKKKNPSAIDVLGLIVFLQHHITFFNEDNNKKNAEHTRMYTNFRAFLLNIHVGCCLFSHKPKQHQYYQ